jgi:hypothetical protein
MASGDDVVLLTTPDRAQRVYESMMRLSSRQKYQEEPLGLGQVISEISMTPIEGASFLSKTFHYNGGKLFCHPDYNKMLNTKEYYMGQNTEMHRNPWAYMELKRRQYGPASKKLDLLLTVAREFHEKPQTTDNDL